MTLSTDHRRILHDAARGSIAYGLRSRAEQMVDEQSYPEPLAAPAATFVTLRYRGELLGCIGTLRPVRPLISDVVHNAYHAAFSDSRFEPVSSAHLVELDVHITVLGPIEPLTFGCETELLDQLRVGVDGLVISEAGLNATFLPAMWQPLPEPARFLRALKEKAGLPEDYWSPTVAAARYTTEDV